MAKSICLFNHKGGVSKTTTAFNLGWSLADVGKKTLMVDLDSQCNLTGIVLGFEAVDDTKLDAFYKNRDNLTMKPIVEALINGVAPSTFMATNKGKLRSTKHKNLFLLPGYIDVADLDAQISVSLKIAVGVPSTKNIPGNLPNILQDIAAKNNIDYILYDLSPNVGGLNEVALMSSDYFIVPTSPDYFCLQAISSLEKNISKWHEEIEKFKEDNRFDSATFPIKNKPKFIGAIQQRYRPRNEQPAKSFLEWIDSIRSAINSKLVPSLDKIGCSISYKKMEKALKGTGLIPYDLQQVPDFNSLIAISQNLSKPIFALTDEDIGQVGKVQDTMVANRDKFSSIFKELARRVIMLTE